MSDIVYTTEGFARRRLRIELSASTDVIKRPSAYPRSISEQPQITLEAGTIIQRGSPHTYGDWFAQDMKALALSREIFEPVVLPKILKPRKYVHADLNRLGLSYIFSEQPILIRRALVLHKQQPGHIWTADDVASFRRRLGISPPKPFEGSIVYLSRLGVRSELPEKRARDTKSEIAENVISRIGGTVIRTEGLSFSDFSRHASQADIVVGDHGAAMFNLIQWSPRQVVELVSHDWWNNCFLVLSNSLGVAQHTIITPQDYTDDEFEHRLLEAVRTSRTI